MIFKKTIAGLFVAAFSLITAHSQELLFRKVFDETSDTHIEVTSLFSEVTSAGYHPARVVIQNNLAIPQTVFLQFQSSSDYQDTISTNSEFSFFVKPGESIGSDILVPLCPQNGASSYRQLSVKMIGSMGKQSTSQMSEIGDETPAVLLSAKLHVLNSAAFDKEIKSKSSGSYRSRKNFFSSRFDPKMLPADWRAFAGYDVIMLTDEEWRSIPPSPRTAIISWIRQGGKIVIYTSGNFKRKELGLPDDSSFGKIMIKRIPRDLRLNASKTVNFVKSLTKKSGTVAGSIINDYESSWPLQIAFGTKSFNYVSFLIILVTFGIVVGPVNLFVLAKSGRRHRLFITTPIISLVTSLILIALIIFQDGFGGDGTRMVLMEVRPDNGENAAYIHQEQFARTGVVTSSTFNVNASAFITPVTMKEGRWARFTDDYNTRGTYDLQPVSGGLNASGGWFQSRSEQGQLITAVVPTRGRIEIKEGEKKITSTFNFPIEKLIYQDESGDWFEAKNITKGQTTKLNKIERADSQKFINKTAFLFAKRNKQFFKKSSGRKGYFIAISKKAPAIETFSKIDWKTTTVITGPVVR